MIAIVLAYFEVQIEGQNGWASELPTWRINSPNLTWIFGGRPVTGYHVSLNLLLLLFFHWPFIFTKWNVQTETEIISAFTLLAVIWDFLWFVINPYYGIEKYSNANIWWFENWFIGVPVDYFFGIMMAVLVRCIPAAITKSTLKPLLMNAVKFVGYTLVGVTIFTLIISFF